MSSLIFVFLAVLIVAFAVLTAAALWKNRSVSSLAASSGFFGSIGVLVGLLAVEDNGRNRLAELDGRSFVAYSWDGLPQLAYDLPFYVAFALIIGMMTIAGRRLYRRRLNKAALAPQEQAVRAETFSR